MPRHTDEEMRAMVRKYTMESSSNMLSEHHRLDHVVQEMKFMVAVNLGFSSYAELERTIMPKPQSTMSFVEKHNLGRRVDDEDRRRGGL